MFQNHLSSMDSTDLARICSILEKQRHLLDMYIQCTWHLQKQIENNPLLVVYNLFIQLVSQTDLDFTTHNFKIC